MRGSERRERKREERERERERRERKREEKEREPSLSSFPCLTDGITTRDFEHRTSNALPRDPRLLLVFVGGAFNNGICSAAGRERERGRERGREGGKERPSVRPKKGNGRKSITFFRSSLCLMSKAGFEGSVIVGCAKYLSQFRFH